jgi:hypothetical protein
VRLGRPATEASTRGRVRSRSNRAGMNSNNNRHGRIERREGAAAAAKQVPSPAPHAGASCCPRHTVNTGSQQRHATPTARCLSRMHARTWLPHSSSMMYTLWRSSKKDSKPTTYRWLRLRWILISASSYRQAGQQGTREFRWGGEQAWETGSDVMHAGYGRAISRCIGAGTAASAQRLSGNSVDETAAASCNRNVFAAPD